MDLYTKLSDRVLDLETTKTTQKKEIASLKKRVKKLERKRKSKTLGMKRLIKVARSAQVVSSELNVLEVIKKLKCFDTDVFIGEEVFCVHGKVKIVEEVVSTAEVSVAATITTKEITLAQVLIKLRSAKPNIMV
ncbi:hypothetical protein Tco_0287298 [Tanacetum coccineum]